MTVNINKATFAAAALGGLAMGQILGELPTMETIVVKKIFNNATREIYNSPPAAIIASALTCGLITRTVCTNNISDLASSTMKALPLALSGAVIGFLFGSSLETCPTNQNSRRNNSVSHSRNVEPISIKSGIINGALWGLTLAATLEAIKK